MGPYGPIWAYMGPYGPICTHMGPIWAPIPEKSQKFLGNSMDFHCGATVDPKEESQTTSANSGYRSRLPR